MRVHEHAYFTFVIRSPTFDNIGDDDGRSRSIDRSARARIIALARCFLGFQLDRQMKKHKSEKLNFFRPYSVCIQYVSSATLRSTTCRYERVKFGARTSRSTDKKVMLGVSKKNILSQAGKAGMPRATSPCSIQCLTVSYQGGQTVS